MTSQTEPRPIAPRLRGLAPVPAAPPVATSLARALESSLRVVGEILALPVGRVTAAWREGERDYGDEDCDQPPAPCYAEILIDTAINALTIRGTVNT